MNNPIIEGAGVFCLLITVFLVLVSWFGLRRRRRHGDLREEWADQNGWRYTVRPDVEWGRRLPGRVRRGVEYTFARFIDGRQIDVAQYLVSDSDGASHHHVVTVAALSRPLPTTVVSPRGSLGRLFGRGDTPTGNPAFDKAFRVRTDDPALLLRWFSPQLIEAHLNGQVPSSWSVQGAELLCHHPGRLDVNAVPGHAAVIFPLALLLDPAGIRGRAQ